MEIEFGAQGFVLLPQRALWWPAAKTLLVADVHLGKGAAFRALGQPVPRGSSEENLQRLSMLLHQYAVQRLVVLGDWTHSKQGMTARLQHMLTLWRAQHTAVQMDMILGNHDRHLQADERFTWHARLQLGEQLWAVHEAADAPVGTCGISGHVHPAVRVGTGRHAKLTVPCFIHSTTQLILPAFGSLTGTYTLRGEECSAADKALYLCLPHRVAKWP